MICYSSGTTIPLPAKLLSQLRPRTLWACKPSTGAELIVAESLRAGGTRRPGTEGDCRGGNRVFVSNRRQVRGLSGRFAHQRTHVSRQAPRPDGVRLPITIEKPCLDVPTPFQRSK